MKIPVRTENGWQIDAILDTTYVATKDGETVKLEADTLEQMELLIALREWDYRKELIEAEDKLLEVATQREVSIVNFCPNCGAEVKEVNDER